MSFGLNCEELERAKQMCRDAGFEMDKELGHGAFGIVFKAKKAETVYAVKILSKHILNPYPNMRQYWDREVQLQMKLIHPNVVRLYQLLENDIAFAIVMEYCDTSLDEYRNNSKNPKLPEAEVRNFARQLVSGLHVLYEAKIAHRDLKPANILMKQSPSGGWILKLADFGFAKHADMLQTNLGTPIFRAPEVGKVGKQYGPEVDLWSLGAILYLLLENDFHVSASNVIELETKLADSTPSYSLPLTSQYSPHCRDFITNLLTKNPKYRMTFQKLFSHPFVMPSIHFITIPAFEPPQVETPPNIQSFTVESGDFVNVNPSRGFVLTWQPLLNSLKLSEPMSILFEGKIIAPNTPIDFQSIEMTVVLLNPLHLPKIHDVQGTNWANLLPNPQKRQQIISNRDSANSAIPNSAKIESEILELQLIVRSCGECYSKSSGFIKVRSEIAPAVIILCEQLKNVIQKTKRNQLELERVLKILRDYISKFSTPSSSPPTTPQNQTQGSFEMNVELFEEEQIDDGVASSGPTNLIEPNTNDLVSLMKSASELIEDARKEAELGSRNGLTKAASKLPELLAQAEYKLTESRASLSSVEQSFIRSWNRVSTLISSSISLNDYNNLLIPLRDSIIKINDDIFKRSASIRSIVSDYEHSFRVIFDKHSSAVNHIIESAPINLLKIRPNVQQQQVQQVTQVVTKSPSPPPSPTMRSDVQRLREQLSRSLSETEELRKKEESLRNELAEKDKQHLKEMEELRAELERQKANVYSLGKDVEGSNAKMRETQEKAKLLEKQVEEQQSLLAFLTEEYNKHQH